MTRIFRNLLRLSPLNLEDIEQRTLRYLEGVSNPLVRVDILLDHLREDDAFPDLDEARLIEFLTEHELFRIIEPLAPLGGPHNSEALSEISLPAEHCVILDTRVPSQEQLLVKMMEQVTKMVDALRSAFEEAKSTGDVGRMQSLQDVLDRSSELQRKLTTLVQPSSD